MNAAAEAKLRTTIDAASDDDLRDLWDRRHDLGPPRFVAAVEGLLLATIADRGLDPPPLEAETRPAAPPAPSADRDHEIIDAVLAGESARAVAERYGLSAGHVRRITAKARRSGATKPQRPALRVVRDDTEPLPEPDLTAAERVLGPWTEHLPDERTPAEPGDPIPTPPPPDLFGLFYRGRLNVLAGAPATGKSYAALATAAEGHSAGDRLLWLDAEDSAATFTARCLQIGAAELTTSPNVRRVDHGAWQAAEPEHIALCWEWLAGGDGFGFVVIDSGTATGSGDSLDGWLAWTKRHLPPPGVGVLLLEHVVKRIEERYMQAAGSRGKLAAVTGLHAQLDETDGLGWAPATDEKPPTPGGWPLYATKDKPAGHGVPRGTLLGTLNGIPHDDGTLTVEFVSGGRTAGRVEAAARYVADNPGQPTSKVAAALPGKADLASKAILRAEEQGLITRVAGPRGAKLCFPSGYPD